MLMIQPDKLPFKEEVDVLNRGGVCIFPTDTVFALSCRIDKPDAIKKIFDIKKRDSNKAVPILVDGIAMAEEYVLPIEERVKTELLEKYWPGALTVIMKSRPGKISPLLSGGSDTIAVRMPDHEVALSLISGCGVPLVGTSANFAGNSTPFTPDQIDTFLIMKVDFFTPGVCQISKPSTVIDVTQTPWQIVRPGAVTLTNI